MKKYEKYKDSGIEWIGEIPEHWEVSRGKEVLKFTNGFPFNSSLFSKNKKDGFPLVRIRDIKSEKITTFYKGEIVSSAIIDDNDFIIGMDGDFNLVRWNKGRALLNQRLCKIEGTVNLNVNYLAYSIPFYLKIIHDLTYFTTVKHLSNKDLLEQKYLIPPYEEQTAIANYLDEKTTQIDHLIAKKEELIRLLEEERTAVINELVTGKKVWNGDAWTEPSEVKDSGIEWLGEIPEHWELKRLRYIGNCQNGISAGAEYFGSGFPFVSYSDVYKNEVLPFRVDGLAQSNEKEQAHYSIEIGDVLFTRTSETIEEIGISSVCFQTIDSAVFAGFLIRFRPFDGKLNINFSKFFFKSKIPRTFFVKEMNLVTRASLSQALLKRLPVLLPPIEEQEIISEFLNLKSKEIDDLVSKTQHEVELLKEYKTALISEVVTGKVDVRDYSEN